MKRRWSNNGGFALRMLEESSSEVTSSSAGLIMSPSLALSPNSLGSPEYGGELDLWGYDDNPLHGGGGGGGNGPGGGGGGAIGHLTTNGGGGGATNINGVHHHNHHHHLQHGTGATVLQNGIGGGGNVGHHLHGVGGINNHHGVAGTPSPAAVLMGGVNGAAHLNRLAQGMVNEFLAVNGANGVGGALGLDMLGHNGSGLGGGGGVGVITNTILASSRSSTSPSIGK